MQTTILNNEIVRPVVLPPKKKVKVPGENLFETQFANIFILSKKNSGKSTILSHIVKNSLDRNTRVELYASTVDKDPVYRDLTRHLESKHVPTFAATDFIEEINHIDRFLTSQPDSVVREPEQPPPCAFGGKTPSRSIDLFTGGSKEPVTRVKRAEKPNHILIFDDLGEGLRNSSVTRLLKVNRHHRAKVIMSSQWLRDMMPASLRQIDYFLVLKGLPLERLQQLYAAAAIPLEFNKFVELYDYCTREAYSFLYIDIQRGEFRCNFNQKVVP